MGKLDGAVSTDILFRQTWQNCLPTFQPSYILAARRSKQDAAQGVVLLPPSSNTTTIASLVMPAITRIATNQLYFSCVISNYLSHYSVLVQRRNSHLVFVRRLCLSVQYLLLRIKTLMVAHLTLVNQIFHTKP